MKILADASIPGLNAAFPKPFELTLYHSELELHDLLNFKDILLCRSTLKVDQKLLDKTQLKYVATASSGVDHLDHNYLHSKQIQIIDAKGCNAISVADYVESCLAYLSKQQLLSKKTAGIIGMGKVGNQLARRLQSLNFQLNYYDPLKASKEHEFYSCDLEDLYKCDILCVHAEFHKKPLYPSFNLINEQFLAQLKPGCIIINAARGGIVNEEALLNLDNPLIYCTDVYLNEPKPNPLIIDRATICTPHIAGHSLEAKLNAVAMVSEKLHQLFGLQIPVFEAPELKSNEMFNAQLPWPDRILSLYNPINETNKLKQAQDIQSEFHSLRKNHSRHDFSIYQTNSIYKEIVTKRETVW